MSSTSLKGKSAIITGASSGIGLATAKLMAAHGANLCLADINEQGVAAVAEELSGLGGNVIYCAVDVASEQSNENMAEKTLSAFGQIDIAHLNAGVMDLVPILGSDVASWQRTLDVNLTGVFFGIRSCAPDMVARGQGSIVVTASVSGILGNKSMPAYTASKHGVVGLVKAASAELGVSGVRINAVCPGATYTQMMLDGGLSLAEANKGEYAKMSVLGRIAEAKEIGEMVCFLASDASSYMTGGIYPVDGGMSAVGRKPI